MGEWIGKSWRRWEGWPGMLGKCKVRVTGSSFVLILEAFPHPLISPFSRVP